MGTALSPGRRSGIETDGGSNRPVDVCPEIERLRGEYPVTVAGGFVSLFSGRTKVEA